MLNVICLTCDSEWYNMWFFFWWGLKSFIKFISVVEWVCLFSIGFLTFFPLQFNPHSFSCECYFNQPMDRSSLINGFSVVSLEWKFFTHMLCFYSTSIYISFIHISGITCSLLRISLSCLVGYQCAVNIFQSPSVFYISKNVRFNCSQLSVSQFLLSFSIRNSNFCLHKILNFSKCTLCFISNMKIETKKIL